MKPSNRTHRYGLRTLCCAAVLTVAASSGLRAQSTAVPTETPATTKEKSKDPDFVELVPFVVTGSRISRTDAETPSPVVELKPAEIEKMGFPTFGDVIRALPFNEGQALTPTDSGNSFTPGASTANLRGLGNNQTLVLINGRRAVPYASPGFDGLQTVFDFDSIPEAAIESIEILKDGGSAVYGSDAVAGVINVKLRHDYQGVSVTGEIGNYYNTNGLLKKGSLVAGINNGRTSIVTTLDWSEQHEVPSSALAWSANADQTSRAAKANLRYTATGWENVTSATYASEKAYLEGVGATDAIADGWADQRSSRGFPGYIVDPGSGKSYTFSSPTNTPTVAGAVAGTNTYNYQETAGLFPAYRKFGFFTSIHQDFNENIYGFAELSFHRTETNPKAAATPVDIENEHGLDNADHMVLPSYNAFNPWGVDITSGRRRLIELPNRINDLISDTPRLVVGLGGKLPGEKDWTWESAVMYNRNSINNLNLGSVADAQMQQALMGLTRLGNGSLAWDPTTPRNQRVYFNWFGANDPAMGKFLSIANPTSDSLTYWTYDGTLNGHLFQLPAGPVGFAAGIEHHSEKIEHTQTELNATSGIVGGASGTSFSGNRNVTSIYAEADVPVIKQIELQLAARYEDYSDKNFQDKARPKIAVKIRPTSWLVLRSSYSQSFKAPDLGYMFASLSTSFSSDKVPDPVTNTVIDQLQIVTSGNPDLNPETTNTWYGGVVFEAPRKSKFKGLELSLDYFHFDRMNIAAKLSDFYTYADFLSKAAAGDPLFAGKVTRDATTKDVLFITDTFTNISHQVYSGFDFGVNYRFETENLGTFSTSIQATRVSSNKLDGGELIGGYLDARLNGYGTLSWQKGDWGVNLVEIYRGPRHRDIQYGTIYGEGDTLFISYDVKAQYLLNASVSYRGFRDTTITVGATNVLNQAPPEDPFYQTGSTEGIDNLEPGFFYVRMRRDF